MSPRFNVQSSVTALFVFVLVLSVLYERTAQAQIVREDHSTGYWLANGGLTLGAAGLGGLAMLISVNPSPFAPSWTGDASVRGRYSPDAASLADATLFATVIVPVPALLNTSAGAGGASMLVYGQTLSANFMLNTFSKYLVRRPRPYTYEANGKVTTDHRCEEASDRCLSFYSGHSSTAFAMALSSSLMLSERRDIPQGVKIGAFGFELGLASATAVLRVEGGKHFPSDVIVGALVGSAIGVGVPLLHRHVWTSGEHTAYDQVSGAELVAGGAGIVVGTLVPALIDFPQLSPSYEIGALPVPGGAGAQLSGYW